MKRKSLIEAVSPEARDFIEAGTPKPQFVQTQPEKAEGETSPALVPEPPKAAIDPAEKKEISHCGLSILNGVGNRRCRASTRLCVACEAAGAIL